jgi:hypothetical protein
VKVLPAAVNTCELPQTDPESPMVVLQPPGDGVKLPKSTSTASAAPAPPTARMARKTKALANLIMTHSPVPQDDRSSIPPIICQYSPLLRTYFSNANFPSETNTATYWS